MFTPKELEVIKAIGKPKPYRPLTEEDDEESLHRDIDRIRYENEITRRYFAWIRAYTDNLTRIDDALYNSRISDWTESRIVLDKFRR